MSALQTLALRRARARLAPAALSRSTRYALSARNVASASSPGTPSQSSMGYVAGGPIVRDTVNDALPFPTPHKPHGSYHWAFERLLSAALVPATAAAFVVSPTAYPTLDALLGVSLVMHSHIGFDALIVDYLHPRKFPKLGPTVNWTLRATTVGVLAGIYQFNTNDVGLTELVKNVWTA